jgi:hypothetical protein
MMILRMMWTAAVVGLDDLEMTEGKEEELLSSGSSLRTSLSPLGYGLLITCFI